MKPEEKGDQRNTEPDTKETLAQIRRYRCGF